MRVAQRQGDVVYYLHADHLGSTSLTTDSNGAVVARQLYHPYGEERFRQGTLPTDFGFTGQRSVPGVGLVFMHARYYHPALGRFISADTIVPQPGNPQDLNRYAYVRNNPLRYIDPSGRYSEEEIMQAFGVSTWDDVLAHFKDGTLEGKWGWLEVLRRANNCDWVTGSIYDEPHYSIDGFDYPEIGRIYIGSNGEITIGGISQIEFAARWARYSLDSAVHGEYHFSSDAETMYWHSHIGKDSRPLRDRPEDMSGMLVDGISIFLDVGSAIGMWANPGVGWGVQALQVAVDFQQAVEGATSYRHRQQNAQFSSDDVLGMVGWIPWLGSVPDVISAASQATGYKVVWTP